MNTDRLKRFFVHDLGWGWGHQQKIVFDFLCQAADEAEGGVVLDVGAGHQRCRPFFQDAIYLAQEHPVAGQQNMGIVEYDILSDVKEIPLKEASVDLVLSTSSLEHLEYPDAFFMEAHRVPKPGEHFSSTCRLSTSSTRSRTIFRDPPGMDFSDSSSSRSSRLFV